MDISVVLIVFAVIALAELPDKSAFAALVLGTRFRASWVFAGVAAAFLAHVIIAVTAGGLLTLLPHRAVEAVVAVLFAAGALVLLLGREEDEAAEGAEDAGEAAAEASGQPTFWRVALTSFGVVFLGEWGDITQIVTANYAARYDDPVSVAVGATLGLWLVAGLAVVAGQRILRYVSVVTARRVAGVVLAGFAVVSSVTAIRG